MIKLLNKTCWNTRDLRKLIKATLEYEGMSDRDLIIEITHTKVRGIWDKKYLENVRSWYYRGLASVGGYWIKMICPKDVIKVKYYDEENNEVKTKLVNHEFNVEMFAKVLIHELAHIRGLRHKDMIKFSEIKVPDEIKKIKVRLKNDKRNKD